MKTAAEDDVRLRSMAHQLEQVLQYSKKLRIVGSWLVNNGVSDIFEFWWAWVCAGADAGDDTEGDGGCSDLWYRIQSLYGPGTA